VVAVPEGQPWPDIGAAVGRAVTAGDADFGVVMCWTGTGTAIAANKVPGVRAAVVHDHFTAEMTRKHNDANVLALGARVIGGGVAEDALRTFRDTAFEGGRHARRVAKLDELDMKGR
jgi:ribose 5-phosphate isomerase B